MVVAKVGESCGESLLYEISFVGFAIERGVFAGGKSGDYGDGGEAEKCDENSGT